MIIHNRNKHAEEVEGAGLIDTVLSLVNGVIQHKDAIKDVVTTAKDIKTLVTSSDEKVEEEIPEDVKNIIKKIRSLQTVAQGNGFRYI